MLAPSFNVWCDRIVSEAGAEMKQKRKKLGPPKRFSTEVPITVRILLKARFPINYP